MDPASIQRLHSLLGEVTAGNAANLQSATAALNTEFYVNPLCIPGLFEISVTSDDQPIRQIAAVELRKRISQKRGALWVKLTQDIRETLKTKALETISVEQAPLVRHAKARVIAAITEIDLAGTGWPALLPWLHENTIASASVHMKETATFVLFTSLSTIIENNMNSIGQFLQHTGALLSDGSSLAVQSNAFRCLVIIAQYLEADQKDFVRAFQNLVHPMLQMCAAAVQAGEEEVVQHFVDGVETFLLLDTPLISKNIPEIVEFFLKIGSDQSIDTSVREMALNVLVWVIKYKKNKVQNAQLAKPILEILLTIGAEDEAEDADEDSPARSALRVVDTLATNLPPSQVFNPLFELVKGHCQSPNPAFRKSALTALGLSVEGCSEYIRPQIQLIWPFVDAGLQDPAAVVRNAACVLLGCMCEWLDEEVTERHQFVMTNLMRLVNDQATQYQACITLDGFLEVLGDHIALYLNPIMEQLSLLLESAPLKVKSIVTGAIGSAAHASGSDFIPYFPATLDRLRPFFSLTEEGEEQDLRGIAMDALAAIAKAIGKTAFAPYYTDTMDMALKSADAGSPRLKECSFLLYGALAEMFEAEFNPYLPTIVPQLIASCQQREEGDDFTLTEEALAALKSSGALGTGEIPAILEKEDMIDEEELDTEKAQAVNSAIAVEKEIAASTLGPVFTASGEAFLPYLEGSTQELLKLTQHYYEGIRRAASGSLFEYLATFRALSNPESWTPGATNFVPLHQKVQELVEMIIPDLLEALETEDEKDVAISLCEGFAETISAFGPALATKYMDEICVLTLQILERKALCQQDPDQEEEDLVIEEQAEFESSLISSASGIVGALASVLGPDFSKAFQSFMQPMFSYYSANRSATDRNSSIGTLGEIITGLKGGVSHYTQALLGHLLQAFTDEDAEVRSNAAFALGALIEMTDDNLVSQFLPILAQLRPYFEVPADAPTTVLNARDNAVGAVSRMILRNMPAEQVQQVLPTLLSALPLKNDMLENKALFRAIFYLFQSTPETITPFVDQLLPVFAYVLDPNGPDQQLGDEARAQLISLVSVLKSQVPQKVQQYEILIALTQ